MSLMKTILRKIIAVILALWGVIDWGLSTKGIDVYNSHSPGFPKTSQILNTIGDFMITFFIAILIWVGIPKNDEEKNENS